MTPALSRATAAVLTAVRTPALGVAGFAILGGAWELTKALGGSDGRLAMVRTDDASMPHLTTVIRSLGQEDVRGTGRSVGRAVLNGSWFSLRLALGGFVLGLIIGMALALLMQRFKIVERAWMPYIVLSQTVPLIALAPLIVGWGGQLHIGSYEWHPWMSVVAMAAYLSFFPVSIGALRGLQSPKEQSLELMQSYAATSWQTTLKLRLPSAVPYLMPSIKLAAAASVVGAIVAEISSGTPGGIGRLIIDYFQKASGDPSRVFTAFLGAACLGLVVAGFVAAAEKVLTRNRPATTELA